MSWELVDNSGAPYAFTDEELVLLFILYCDAYNRIIDKTGIPATVLTKLEGAAFIASNRIMK